MALLLTIIINGCIVGSIYAIIAMGLSTQYGVARILNLAHGEFIILAAFITYILHTRTGVHPLVAVIIAGPIAFGISFALHITLYRRARKISHGAGGFESNAILIAFGVYFIMQNFIQSNMGGTSTAYLFMPYPVQVGPANISAGGLLVLLIAVIICIAYSMFLARTRMGKAIRAAAQDPQAAAMLGIKIDSVMALCFAIGGFLAACAGVLISMRDTFSASGGMGYTTIAIIVVVLGGLGSVRGAIFGGFILGIVGVAVSSFDTGLMDSVFYLIVLVLLIVRPKGLLGS